MANVDLKAILLVLQEIWTSWPPVKPPQSQASTSRLPGAPQPPSHRAMRMTLRPRPSPGSLNFEAAHIQPSGFFNKIEEATERFTGFYAVYLPASVLRESGLSEIEPEWFYAASILIALQLLSGTKNETLNQIITAARNVVQAERDEVLSRAKLALEDKSDLLDDYHELDLYLCIGKDVIFSEKENGVWINRGEGTFGCSSLAGARYSAWVTKGEDSTALDFTKSKFSQGLWKVETLDIREKVDNEELDKEGNQKCLERTRSTDSIISLGFEAVDELD
ncbi:hypothetical protein B0O99DRAFT_632665 [Bisporella sp. PMI_857]|nr:hypothetical protein B0O99DRAFT_632665 [Bisporella sp. PMI_857]